MCEGPYEYDAQRRVVGAVGADGWCQNVTDALWRRSVEADVAQFNGGPLRVGGVLFTGPWERGHHIMPVLPRDIMSARPPRPRRRKATFRLAWPWHFALRSVRCKCSLRRIDNADEQVVRKGFRG